MNTTDNNELNSYVDEGLPEISGYIGRTFVADNTSNGCAEFLHISNGGYVSGDGSNYLTGDVVLHASWSSSIYGNSQHVTPKSFKVAMWIRTA